MESEVRDFGAAYPVEGVGDVVVDDQPDRRRRRLVANRAVGAIKAQHAAERTRIEAVADWLNDVASSAPFLTLHVIWFAIWIPWNTGMLGLKPFDPYPFGFLTMVVSLEAIFLSIFVLMAQKRESAIAELREEMSLQVGLRLEEEVTKTLQLVAGLYTRMGHKLAEDPELHEMLQPLDVAAIERELLLQIATAAQVRRRQAGDVSSRESPPTPASVPPAP
ncbi:MAG TPA: DUF1003 domain-containing protein [Gemmatimonadaceae bacterium]|nr:DUF1003 domain-containing protein [Gemmatimonadaceae bacterium]